MKYFKLFLTLTLFFSISFQSCRDNDNLITSPIDEHYNIPVIVNTENSYTFTVNADNFTFLEENNLLFIQDSLIVAVTLTNVASRDSKMRIFSKTNDLIFGISLNESKVIVNTELDGQIPKDIIVDLVNFSGHLTIVVALDKS